MEKRSIPPTNPGERLRIADFLSHYHYNLIRFLGQRVPFFFQIFSGKAAPSLSDSAAGPKVRGILEKSGRPRQCAIFPFGTGGQRSEPPSRVDNDFPGGTAEQHLQAVQHIPTEDSLLAREICLKLARILLTIQSDPDQKANRHRHATRNPTDYAGHTVGWIKVQLLAVRPWHCRGIGACVGYNTIQKQACGPGRFAELGAYHWQCRAGIEVIVRETRPADAIPRLVLMPNADNEGVPSRLLDGKKHF